MNLFSAYEYLDLDRIARDAYQNKLCEGGVVSTLSFHPPEQYPGNRSHGGNLYRFLILPSPSQQAGVFIDLIHQGRFVGHLQGIFPNSVLDAEQFGIRSNLAYDSTEEYQSAIDFATQEKGAVRKLRQTVSTRASIAVPRYTEIEGVGRQVEIVSSLNKPVISNSTWWNGVILKGLSLVHDGEEGVAESPIVYSDGGASDCVFDLALKAKQNVTSDGIQLKNYEESTGAGFNNGYSSYFKIRSSGKGAGAAVNLVSSGERNSPWIKARFEHCIPNGFSTGIRFCGQGVTLEDCSFNGQTKSAVEVYGNRCYRNNVKSCYFDSSIKGDDVILDIPSGGERLPLHIKDSIGFDDNKVESIGEQHAHVTVSEAKRSLFLDRTGISGAPHSGALERVLGANRTPQLPLLGSAHVGRFYEWVNTSSGFRTFQGVNSTVEVRGEATSLTYGPGESRIATLESSEGSTCVWLVHN